MEKDLGVHVDSKLMFRDHVNKAVSKANQMTGLKRRSFQYINKKVFLLLFKSRVRP